MPGMTRNLKRKELSRTKLELFCNCARCFYDDVALGLKRPSSPPFTLPVVRWAISLLFWRTTNLTALGICQNRCVVNCTG